MEAKVLITKINNKVIDILMEDGFIVHAHPHETDSLVGKIYTAKVVNIVESINAAFLDIGVDDYYYYSLTDNENRNIFLKHGNSEKVCIGDEILVQVSMDPMKSKKGVASSNVTLKGQNVILTRSGDVGVSHKITDMDKKKALSTIIKNAIEESGVDDGKLGAIVRTAAENASEAVIVEEFKKLLEDYKNIRAKAETSVAKKCIYASESDNTVFVQEVLTKKRYTSAKLITDLKDVYDELSAVVPGEQISFYDDKQISLEKVYDIEGKLTKAFHKTIYLKSGGSIVVEPTEALTVIDVNTGKMVKGKNVQDAFLKLNKEAAKLIARIIRLRNISGIIIIDFISMKEAEYNNELIKCLKAEIENDEVSTKYVDITPLGLVELTRKKVSKPLMLQDLI